MPSENELNQFIESARIIALYIYNDSVEGYNYKDYIKEGNDPRNHVLYHAALILGYEESFKHDIEVYENNE